MIRPHGVRGEVRVRLLTSYPERFKLLEEVVIGHDPEGDPTSFKTFKVEQVRLHGGQGILKLESIDERNQAELLRNQFILVSLANAAPLESGEYYFYQLIGLTMVTDSGEELGEVLDILETGANDVYVVHSPRYGELLIPAIESVVQHIDLNTKRITITPIPGLLPDHS